MLFRASDVESRFRAWPLPRKGLPEIRMPRTQMTDIDDSIVRLVQEFWDEHQKPLLLSQLGAQDIGKQAKEQAGGLRAYVERLDQLTVIQHSGIQALVGVVPRDVRESADDLLNRTQSDTTTYHPAVWAAFRKELYRSKRRYISTEPPINFTDIQEGAPPSGFVEIQREHIANPADRVSEVVRRIKAWLEANHKVDPAVFNRSTMGQRLPANDLLGRVLLALEPDELRRMSIPLDIVRKLRSRSL